MKKNYEVSRQIRRFFTQMNILFWVFLAGIILFGTSVWLVTAGGQAASDPESADWLRFAAPLSGLAMILLAQRLFMARVKKVRDAKTVYEKMEGYRGASVLRMIVLDGAAFVNIMAFLICGVQMLMALCVAVMVVFFLNKPSLEKLIADLRMSDIEAQVLRDHYA